MAKNPLFKSIPLSGGSKEADDTDTKAIEDNLLKFNRPGKRNCLVCAAEFFSEGSHNRHCKKCKAQYGEELFVEKRYQNRRGAERRDCDRPLLCETATNA